MMAPYITQAKEYVTVTHGTKAGGCDFGTGTVKVDGDVVSAGASVQAEKDKDVSIVISPTSGSYISRYKVEYTGSGTD